MKLNTVYNQIKKIFIFYNFYIKISLFFSSGITRFDLFQKNIYSMCNFYFIFAAVVLFIWFYTPNKLFFKKKNQTYYVNIMLEIYFN